MYGREEQDTVALEKTKKGAKADRGKNERGFLNPAQDGASREQPCQVERPRFVNKVTV